MSALPAWAIAVIVVGGVLLALVIADWASRPRTFSLAGRTVVITGGSSGIGKATAVAVLRAGGHVALLARKQALLDEAARELAPLSRGGTLRITTHSVDVTNEAQVKAAVSAITAAHGGRVDGIVASAGVSLPKRFEETTAEEFAWLYNLNVIGCRNVIAACLPHMGGADAAAGGRIVLVSSQAGQSGIYGYSAYSASKFALNGLAQALQHEVYSRHILISQCFPPDTDTPLFAEENRSKPPLTHMLSQATALVQPQVVGDAIVGGMTHWRPFIAVGFDGWMLSQLCSGFAPAGTLGLAIIQVAFSGLFRGIALAYVQSFFSTVAKHDKHDTRGGGASYGSTGSAAAAAAAATGGGGEAAAGDGARRRVSGGGAGAGAAGKGTALTALAEPLVGDADKRS